MNIHEVNPMPTFGEKVANVVSEANLHFGNRQNAQQLILESAFVISTLIKQDFETNTSREGEPLLVDFLRQNLSRILQSPELENQLEAFRQKQAEEEAKLLSQIPSHPLPNPAFGVFE